MYSGVPGRGAVKSAAERHATPELDFRYMYLVPGTSTVCMQYPLYDMVYVCTYACAHWYVIHCVYIQYVLIR